jgi:hypothetical protein
VRLEKWALIAEITSGIAIVVTLIVLILEVQGTTRAIQISTRQSIATRAQELGLTLARDPVLMQAALAFNSGDSMDETTFARFVAFAGANLRIAEEAYLLYLEGQLDESYWNTRAEFALRAYSSPAMRENWFSVQANVVYTPEFSEWFSSALRERYGE